MTGVQTCALPICPVFCGFINGIYDVLPPEAKIVDGDESGGYTAINAGSLHARVNEMKKLSELIDPANRAKYFLQTSYAPAMYLECVAPRTEGSVWHRILKRGFGQLSTREFLRRHLESIVRTVRPPCLMPSSI